jgi:fructose-1,6-bisphosphatase/inositol monophosphatase family enzyme
MTSHPEPDFQLRQMLAALPVDDPVLEVAVAAARAGLLKASALRDADWLGPFIDDLPNPFVNDPFAALAFLEGRDQPSFLSTAPFQPHHVGDAAIVADQLCFDTIVGVAHNVSPGTLVLGEEDGLDVRERGRLLTEAIAAGSPWLLVDPIDGTLAYRRLRNDDYWASVVIAGQGSSFAVCIATGDLVVVALNERFAAVWENGGWRVIAPPRDGEMRDGFSAIVPTTKLKYRIRFRDTLDDDRIQLLCGFSGNPAILRGVLLGLVDAAIQPSCFAWDNAIAYVAACASQPVMRLDTDQMLDAAAVRALTLDSMCGGEKLPDMLVGRDDNAVWMLLSIVEPRDLAGSDTGAPELND